MKKHLLYTVGLVVALLTLSSFTDGPDNTNTYINGHEYVDLGLPSGTKWATCNVGASKPEEYGGYYAWGETEEKSNYGWSTYKWCDGDLYSLTKYCTSSSYGTVDYKTVLDPEDDVAHVKWGGTWRMPTIVEIKELQNECTWRSGNHRGVNGYLVTGPNGKSIFLPAASYRSGEEVLSRGTEGLYWSSSLDIDNRDYRDFAFYLYFDRNSYDRSFNWRVNGLSVRPVSK